MSSWGEVDRDRYEPTDSRLYRLKNRQILTFIPCKQCKIRFTVLLLNSVTGNRHKFLHCGSKADRVRCVQPNPTKPNLRSMVPSTRTIINQPTDCCLHFFAFRVMNKTKQSKLIRMDYTYFTLQYFSRFMLCADCTNDKQKEVCKL